MECNKDEAVRAKEIAEKKLLERDITGAKKIASKAQNLFPKLDGLPQFLEVIDLYAAYEKKVNGEADYYGVFGVDPFADEEVLRKRYKKMALSLHPDKNKSVGAAGAFKVLSEAWSVLSDRDKRIAYNLKLNIRASNQTGSFSSPSARYTSTASDPQHIPTRPRTPATATYQQYTSTPHYPRNTTSGTSSQHIPSGQQTPAAATAVGSQFNPTLRRPAPHQPLDPTPGTSSAHIENYQKRSATVMGSEFISNILPPRNPAPATSYQYSPSGNPQETARDQKIPVPATASWYIPAHRPSAPPQYTPVRFQPTSTLRPSRPDTFWTSCKSCRVKFEYQKVLLNQNLLCLRCQQPFSATEIPSPNVKSRISRPWPFPHQQDMPAASSGSRSVTPSPTVIYHAATSSKHCKRRHEEPINMARDNDTVTKTNSTVPEKLEAASASNVVNVLKREKPVKRGRTNDQKYERAKEGREGTAGGSSAVKRASAHQKKNLSAGQESRSMKELSQAEIRLMVMVKAKREILGRLNGWENKKSKSSHMERVETRDSQNALNNDSVNHLGEDQSKSGLCSATKKTLQPQKSFTLEEIDDVDANADETISMLVPDANFHNFDDDRIEVSFAENQVWAAYDDDDGMPRYYALVHHVISRKPFKMQISWLNSKSSSEFGTLDWIGSGFTKTTGEFRVGKSVVSKRLNSFSHPVKWKKGARGVIQIFPTKGDVWALFRNWSPDWNVVTLAEKIHTYDLVVVLQGYNEDTGVLVAPLAKVAGFTSIFNQILDQREVQTIPREEMFRFSHQVPFYMLNGQEAENVPKGCYELDPAALPLELLKGITDAEAAEERVSEHPVKGRGPEVLSEAIGESASTGKIHAIKRSSVEDAKHVLKYSRRDKGRN